MNKKRILGLLLVMTLLFTFNGCGKKDDGKPTGDGDNNPGQEEQVGDETGDEPSATVEQSGTDTKGYEFNLTIKEKFPMVKAIEKTDYKNLEKKESKVLAMMEAAIGDAFGGGFPLESDSDFTSSDGIDEQVFVVGMEDDDTEKALMEGGIYHSTVDGNYYQYIIYVTKNCYNVSGIDIAEFVDIFKKKFGVIVSESDLKAAAEKALAEAKRREDYYSLEQEIKTKGKGYEEIVTFTVEGFATEEGKIGYYASVGRERKYN